MIDRAKEHGLPQKSTFVKVVLDLGSSGWSDYAAERLWSEPVERDIVALRNVPFLAYGFSFDDWVRVEEIDGDLVVREVVRSRGHSTYRIFLDDDVKPDSAAFAGQRSILEEIGCILERATARLFAIDIPPDTDIYRAYEVLEAGKAAGIWDFEEGSVGHEL